MRTSILHKIFFTALIFIAFSCSKSDTGGIDSMSPSAGKGGSTARITIVGDYLYAVDNRTLKVVNISDALNPVQVNTVDVGMDIETIYSFKNHLFIGSNGGMYIFSLTNPASPTQLSNFQHITSCDPVIANDTFAFVTLRSTQICQRNWDTKEIQVLNIQNLSNPIEMNTYFTSSPPYGLDMNNDYLFVCHGSAGFSVYNKKKIINSTSGALISTISGVNAFDAILYNNILFIVGESGFYQYDYSNINNITLLSSVATGS